MYGLETICLTQGEQQNEIDAFQIKCVRRIIKIPPIFIEFSQANQAVRDQAMWYGTGPEIQKLFLLSLPVSMFLLILFFLLLLFLLLLLLWWWLLLLLLWWWWWRRRRKAGQRWGTYNATHSVYSYKRHTARTGQPGIIVEKVSFMYLQKLFANINTSWKVPDECEQHQHIQMYVKVCVQCIVM